MAFRRLTADQWFIGKEVREDKAPFGLPLYLNINSVDVTVSYGVTDRLSVAATVPFSNGSHSRYYADGNRHEVSAAGLGDVSVTGSLWLLDPHTHSMGNIAVGIGVKTASGRNDVTDAYYLKNGTSTFTVDQSIQLGDGGWGVILQFDAFKHLFGKTDGYASGSYLVSARNQTAVLQSPTGDYSSVHVSVPDVFNTRAGASVDVSGGRGLALSVGARIDGIPLRDIIGGSDGFRRPVLLGYVEPGVTVTRGTSTVFVNFPIRIYQDFRPSLIDGQLGSVGGGDLAKYLTFVGYQIRF